MLELTKEECLALENAVVEKLYSHLSDDSSANKLVKQIARIASIATITTIQEYERMKESQKDNQ